MEGIRVLFVDDETDFLETMLKRMARRGLNVAGSESGEEALSRIKGKAFDVVVLDVRMPGMDGIDTLREIKRLRPLVEVIMLTGHACLEAAREGMEVGAFDYLMKPVNIDELLYKVQDAYQKKHLQEEKIRHIEEVMTTCEVPQDKA